MIPVLRCLVLSLLTWTAWAGPGKGVDHPPSPGPAQRLEVPAPLRPWVPWVLYGHDDWTCPRQYDDPGRRYCAWPGELRLELDREGGRFAQTWEVYGRTRVPLPGGPGAWPERIRVDDAPGIQSPQDERPGIWLDPGTHRIEGRWVWPRPPRSLPIPRAVGIVALSVEGEPHPFPRRDARGTLWLAAGGSGKTPQDHLRLEVFRRLQDGNPARLETLLRLDVSGRERERVLGPALPPQFRPLALGGDLPARLEADGRLRIQLRPGHWEIAITAIHPRLLTAVSPPAARPPWPSREVWAFQADRRIRLVEVRGGTPLEPRHTRLPADWRDLPAYALKPGQALTLRVLRRGDPAPLPDRIRVQRRLWLDFDGGGYTFSDHLQGTLSASWRLDMRAPWYLGRVSVDGQDQVISAPGKGLRGVELRRGALDLVADGRIAGAPDALPAVGWNREVQGLGAELSLPPGWRLLHLSGADQVDTTWLRRWSLWDLFLTLLIAIAMGRLWSWPWGLSALAVGLSIYQEPGAPVAAWLNLLAAVALLRVAPAGRLAGLLRLYRHLSLAVLAVLGLAFAIGQVRTALYPQLARAMPAPAPAPARVTPKSAPLSALRMEKRALELSRSMPEEMPTVADEGVSREIDPKARVTTGPGLPTWRWTRVRLAWTGPVAADQELRLWLLPPWATRLWQLFGVLGLAALGWPLVRGGRLPPGAPLVLILAVVAAPLPARADIPGPGLLETLEKRLLEAPDCTPHCARYGTLRLGAKADTIEAQVDLDAVVPSVLPLPGDDRHWRLLGVSEDGRPLPLAHLDEDGTLWTAVGAGHHRLRLRARIPADTTTLPIPATLMPRRVVLEGSGWTLEGVDPRGTPQGQIQLRRRAPAPAASSAGEPSAPALPPFFQVEREIRLGLEWSIHTRVYRDPANPAGAVLSIPLLPGESVTTPGLRVEEDRARVAFAPGQQERHWDATLARRPRLRLQAPEGVPWAEIWRLDAAPLWHVQTGGIPVVQRQDPNGRWRPEWRPWPGEVVELAISRPPGIEGPTLTIDRSHLRLVPGRRSSDATLELQWRSSQGGQHRLTLPQGATLQRVTIDGRIQPVRQRGRHLDLPLTPGGHRLEVRWRQAGGMTARFTVPRADLGLGSVNATVQVNLPRDRWLLYLRGPLLGPAVLYWGVLLAIFAAALILGRSRITPLRRRHWALLGLGLSQTPAAGMVLVAAWLFALGIRGRRDLGALRAANLAQIGLALLSLMALGTLAYGVQRGLLGPPEMQVAGNGSSAYDLRWYLDRTGPETPAVTLISAPLWVYRALMLGWALWLANALLGWLRWGWRAFSRGGIWIPWRFKILRPQRTPPPGGAASPRAGS